MSPARILGDETITALLRVLNPEPDCTRVVGGAVRNALLNETVKEIDLATKLLPQRVSELAEAAGYKAVPTGIEFGTVTVVIDRRAFEVTTLREDIETNGRHAKVKFGTSWEKDAARRDFTINALYLDANGKVHDPLGGLKDLEQRRVRFINDARTRIKEDYLRIWRFFRFSAQYGEGNFDVDGLMACLQERDGLPALSAERVKQELFKLLIAPYAADAAVLMCEMGLSVAVLGVQYLHRLKALADSDANQKRKPDALERLAALCVQLEEDAVRLTETLRLSRAENRLLYEIAGALQNLRRMPDEKRARILLHKFPLGYESAVRIASGGAWEQLISLPQRKPIPDFPVKGADLLALGYQAGPKLGQVLSALENKWISSDFSLTREQLLVEVKK
jgi:tRNA nucleotidyltransferase/poly(A) polymerase